ncbi:unnamed protein product [Brugia timori]|uniref:Ovule protein n=1 Tax=Brugia timori TaxID=42155 RepID=A0A0R3QHF9_9BILA|nr:unnamed protein product [Brugia timori]
MNREKEKEFFSSYCGRDFEILEAIYVWWKFRIFRLLVSVHRVLLMLLLMNTTCWTEIRISFNLIDCCKHIFVYIRKYTQRNWSHLWAD